MSLWHCKAVNYLVKSTTTYIFCKIVEGTVSNTTSFQLTTPNQSFPKLQYEINSLKKQMELLSLWLLLVFTSCITTGFCIAAQSARMTDLSSPVNCTPKSSHGQATKAWESQDRATLGAVHRQDSVMALSLLLSSLSLTICTHSSCQPSPMHTGNVNLCWLLRTDLKPPKEQSLDVTHVPDSGNRSPWCPWSPALAKGKAGNSTQALQAQILLEHKASLQL